MSPSTATQEIFKCPACEQPVSGTLSLDLTLGEVTAKEVKADVKVTGLRVQHDCIPKSDYRAHLATALREAGYMARDADSEPSTASTTPAERPEVSQDPDGVAGHTEAREGS